MTDAGWYLKVWLRGDRHITIEAGDVNRLDAEVASYVEDRGAKDRMIHLTALHGGSVVVLASEVAGWVLSTPETRRRELEQDQEYEDEERSNKADLGIFDS